MNDGDWICADANCGNINFARRAACYRCNKERPDGGKPSKKKLGIEIGKSAAEKSRGLFNADDWQCNKCANVNWARRHTCNVCNAPKFGEVEARTGYGGGYNERGVVEYRRREPSSEDEYDEFGRKKRKRKSEAQDKVGITEGPVNKKLPPTALQKEIKKDHIMPVPAPNLTLCNINRGREKVNGSLSDGSVCDLPPLTKVAFRRNQVQNQTNYYKPEHMVPGFKSNLNGSRKRFSSIGDRDQTGSSGYETGSRKKNELPIIKTNNPVMENRVSSTNNDVVYKFTGPTPAEDFQVTYTVEERVRAAAFAIVHNNCKISTTKFESLYDKPAPDFKTIFGWRQRLLSTGCLVDSHLELHKKETQNEINTVQNTSLPDENKTRKKKIQVLPNPDEIPIFTDSDEGSLKNVENINKPLPCLRQRSMSAETLLLGGMDGNIRAGGSITSEERESQVRSHSASTRHRTRSSSRDSQDSNYPDTDSENMGIKNTKVRPRIIKTSRSPIHETDSDSVSYNSDDGDFLSRVYEDGRKIRRKVNRGSTPISKLPNYSSNEINGGFQGYNTVQSSEQSPLVTGNIYTSNLHNMNVKRQESTVLDTDGCSSEYVPTRLGSTAKKNYQEFRDNVKKKGYWAKGNGASIGKNKSSTVTSVTIPTIKNVQQPTTQNYFTETLGYVTAPPINRTEDFTKDEFDNFSSIDYYTPFDKPLKPTTKMAKFPEQSIENSTRIFDVVQSNSASKNRSIMDIFNTGDLTNHSPERDNDLEKYANVHKMYETEWDDDDDALYKNTDPIETFSVQRRTPSPPSIGSLRTQSPMSKMLYTADTELEQPVGKSNKVNLDFINDRRDMLLDLLKDFQKGKEQEINDNEIQTQPTPTEHDRINDSDNILYPQSHSKILNNVTIIPPEPKVVEMTNKLINISTEAKSKPLSQETPKSVSPSKRVHVLDSITIQPNTIQTFPSIVSQNSVLNKSNQKQIFDDINTHAKPSTQDGNLEFVALKESENTVQKIGQVDFTNLLAGINTNNLLLALQNLQQLQSVASTDTSNTSEQLAPDHNNIFNNDVQQAAVETINLTNDEDWEKESNRDGSIERQLEKLDGNTGDTPFLSDIFDPGPVVMPATITKKLNINLKFPEESKMQDHTLQVNDNAPVIGNFKSFALPKPILLNRLKLAIKPSEKHVKKSGEGKKKKRKKQGKATASQDGDVAEEEDDEESGDEADLSKYDLWGSDGEQGNSSNMENADKVKDNENSKESGVVEQTDKNGKSNAQEAKSSRRRSRSSSSSSSSTSSSSSSHSSTQAPKNKYDDFNLNSEREGSPKRRKSRSRSRSPRSRSATSGTRRKSRDSRSAGESRSHESTRDKEKSRDRDRRDRSRGSRDDRKERRYSRDGPSNHYGARGRHR